MASWMHVVAVVLCAGYLCSLAYAQGTDDNFEIHRTLDDNTLERTRLLNVANDSGLSETLAQESSAQTNYEFLNTGDFRNYFKLSSTSGNVQTSQLVDRDVLCPMQATCLIEMTVGVRTPSRFVTVKVYLTLDDVNDNAPRFSQSSLTFDLLETTVPGSITPLAPATDLDSPRNGVQEYRFSDVSGLFGLNASRGVAGDADAFELRLELRTQLDREQQGVHFLQVLAVDGGVPARTGTLSLTINVVDVNDHQPVFDQDVYEIDVSEYYEVNETVVQVSAFDADVGDNGAVQYSFNAQTQRSYGDVFRVDAQTGAIVLRQALDHEVRASYSLTVIAQDQGENSVPSNAKVLITVLDENDVTPRIILNDVAPGARIRIAENLGADLYVGHVSVVDDDSGVNGQVECELNYGRLFSLVELFEKEYKIVTAASLDREVNPVIMLVVQCHDLGRPSLQSQLEVMIEVIDADDSRPTFSVDHYIASVQENNDVGAFVVQVTAEDNDIGENGRVEYSLQNDTDLFAIDATSGRMTALVSFDREEQSRYDVIVMASNVGENAQSSTATVTVHINDVDDNAPTFVAGQQWTFHVMENAARGTLIGSVSAFDADAAPHNNFTYQLDPSYNTENRFAINRIDGSIRSSAALDRELRDNYELHVQTISSANPNITDSLYLQVVIDDENDNAPDITFPTAANGDVTIASSVPLGYRVLRIMAYDIDDGENARLVYHVMNVDGSESEHFAIDAETGTLFVHEGFDEAVSVNYSLQVTVSDHGEPPRSSDVILTVIVNSSYAHTGDDEPRTGKSDGSSSGGSSGSSSLLAVLLGSITGVIVVILLIVISILLLRRRRQNVKPPRETSVKMWSQSDVIDIATSSSSGDVGGELSNVSKDADVHNAVPDVTLHTDQQQHTRADSPHSSTRDSHAEKDSDSGCFDLSHADSQSSSENGATGNSQQVPSGVKGLNLMPSKCYPGGGANIQPHPQPNSQPHNRPHNQPNSQPHNRPLNQPNTATISRSQSLTQPNKYTNMPSSSKQYLQPPVNQLTYNISPSDSFGDDIPPPPPPLLGSYPISQANYFDRGTEDARPFPLPPPLAGASRAPQQHYPRFTDYLQNESHQLQQRGHVYRVSNPSHSRPDVAAAAAATAVAPVRKTVRFSADAKNNEPTLLDASTLDRLHTDNSANLRAVPNSYVDASAARHIALQRSESLNSAAVGAAGRHSQTYLPLSPSRDSGVCMRGLSSLELDSLV